MYGVNFYDRQSEPITLEEWTRLGFDPAYKRVDETRVGPFTVYTDWTGIDRNPLDEGGRPIIFESVVSVREEHASTAGFGPELQRRTYTSEDEARRGHHELVALLALQRDDEHDREESAS